MTDESPPDVLAELRAIRETVTRLGEHARKNADTLLELLHVLQKHATTEEDRMAHFEAHVLMMRTELNVVRADLMAMRAGNGATHEGE